MDSCLTKKESLAYAIPSFTSSLPSQIISFYILYFYTDILQLSMTYLPLCLLITRFLDSVDDLLIGYYLDAFNKHSKLTYYLKKTTIPLLILSPLIFYVPNTSDFMKFVFTIVIYIVWDTFKSFSSAAYSGILPTISRSATERSKLKSFSIAMSIFAVLIVITFFLPLANVLKNIFPTNNFFIATFIFCLIALPFHIFGINNINERYYTEYKQSSKSNLHLIFKDKYLIAILLMYFFYWVSNAFRNLSTAHYMAHVMKNEKLSVLYFTIGISSSLLMQLFIPKLVAKFNLENLVLIGLLGSTLGILTIYFSNENFFIILLGDLIIGCFSAIPANLIFVIILSKSDEYYNNYKVNITILVYSVASCVSKAGIGLASVFSSLTLKKFDYDLARADSALSIIGIKFNFIVWPTIAMFLAFLCMLLCIFFAHHSKNILYRKDTA